LTVGAWFKPELKSIIKSVGVVTTFDNSRSRAILGIEYGNINKSLVEMTYSMFETGALRDRRNKAKA
jgi:hypothetical protein